MGVEEMGCTKWKVDVMIQSTFIFKISVTRTFQILAHNKRLLKSKWQITQLS